MKWIDPVTIDSLLDAMLSDPSSAPPSSNSVYLVSRHSWNGKPDSGCAPLYIGSNTQNPDRFRTRIGDLLADAFGFFTDASGHHSGGQSLNEYCQREKVNPKQLYIGWLTRCACSRCAENELYETLRPLLNKNRPSKCKAHHKDS